MLAEKESEHPVEIEVVPFYQCADRGSGNDPRQAHRASGNIPAHGLHGCRHHHLPPRRLLPPLDYTQTTATFKCPRLGASSTSRRRSPSRQHGAEVAPADDVDVEMLNLLVAVATDIGKDAIAGFGHPLLSCNMSEGAHQC